MPTSLSAHCRLLAPQNTSASRCSSAQLIRSPCSGCSWFTDSQCGTVMSVKRVLLSFFQCPITLQVAFRWKRVKCEWAACWNTHMHALSEHHKHLLGCYRKMQVPKVTCKTWPRLKTEQKGLNKWFQVIHCNEYLCRVSACHMKMTKVRKGCLVFFSFCLLWKALNGLFVRWRMGLARTDSGHSTNHRGLGSNKGLTESQKRNI